MFTYIQRVDHSVEAGIGLPAQRNGYRLGLGAGGILPCAGTGRVGGQESAMSTCEEQGGTHRRGMDLDDIKQVLGMGIWVQDCEGARFLAGVCAVLPNCVVKDALIACCDGMTGFPEANCSHTCVVHLIRVNEVRGLRHGRNIATCLRSFCTAPTADPALATREEEFTAGEWGHKK